MGFGPDPNAQSGMSPQGIQSQILRLEDMKSMAIAGEDYDRAAQYKEEIDMLRFNISPSSRAVSGQGPTIDALEQRLAHLRSMKSTAVAAQDYDMAEEYRVSTRHPLSTPQPQPHPQP